MTVLGERLLELLRLRGISQAELSRRVGITQPAVNHLIKRGTGGSAHLHKIARVLETSPEYLAGESDDPSPNTMQDRLMPFGHAPADRDPDSVQLMEYDLAFGLGASFIHDQPANGQPMTFSRAWIRHFTTSPFDQLYWAHGIGDSMTPTIQHADVVLIDTAQRTPRIWDQLWALDMGGLGMIKRLRPTKDGTGMRILSDGGQPEEVAFDGEMNVIGRVVAIVRKV